MTTHTCAHTFSCTLTHIFASACISCQSYSVIHTVLTGPCHSHLLWTSFFNGHFSSPLLTPIFPLFNLSLSSFYHFFCTCMTKFSTQILNTYFYSSGSQDKITSGTMCFHILFLLHSNLKMLLRCFSRIVEGLQNPTELEKA